MNILFVCSSNTCRSPIAETLMDDAIDRSSSLRGNVKTESAGTFAVEDAEATPEAMRVMEEMGLSLQKHRSDQFTAELAAWADLIFSMGREHMEHMEVIAPEEVHKMHTLQGYVDGVAGEPVDDRYDIADPYDQGMDEYRACAGQIQEAVEKLAYMLEMAIDE